MIVNDVVINDFGGGGVFSLFVHIYWGVKKIDTSKNSIWDAVYIGEVEFDDTFNIYSEEA